MLVLFIVVLVVLVLVGVVVAVLRDSDPLLPDVERDFADVGLPADRLMSSADVDALRFSLALRGYRMAEVDDALARLAAELELRDQTIAELRSPGALPEPQPDAAVEAAPSDG